MITKCNIYINKYNNKSLWTQKSFESFVWKDTNWKHIELRLSILQNKIMRLERIMIERYKNDF
jgi:hypothetical protein